MSQNHCRQVLQTSELFGLRETEISRILQVLGANSDSLSFMTAKRKVTCRSCRPADVFYDVRFMDEADDLHPAVPFDRQDTRFGERI